MANQSVLELAVGTGKWDSGLKKAQQSLNNFVNASGGLDKALQSENEKISQFVKMMGDMTSKAGTAKGQMNDYKRVLEQLTAQYNSMSEAQKSTIGQDFLQSIDKIKVKFQDAKSQVEEFNRSLGEIKAPEIGTPSGNAGGGWLGGLGDKMSGALQVFAGNMMTKAAGALANLGSEMTDMVKQGVELARQGEGIRIAFERLGRGDILDGLREATHGTVTDLELMKAAVKFNDFKLPVEELGTMLAFAQQKAKDTGQSVDYMVDSIVTGLGRKSLMILDNLGLSATEVKEKMKETGDMTKAVGEIIREQMAKAGDYVETAADRAAQANVSLQNKMEELGRKFAPVEEASSQLWTSMKIGILDIIGGPLTTLLNQLTEAGRLKNQLNNMNGGGMMERFGNNLRNSKDPSTLYSRQLAAINRSINTAEAKLQQAEKGGMGSIQIYRERVQALKEFKKQYEDLYKTISSLAKNPLISSDADKKKTKKGGGKTETVKTEELLNNEEIQKLTQEYLKASKQRQEAIRAEIKTLQDRNAQIQRLKDEATGKAAPLGMVTTQVPVSLVGPVADIETKMKSVSGVAFNLNSENPFEKYKDVAIGLVTPLQALENELKSLQEAQAKAWSPEVFAAYQQKIDEVKGKIGVFKDVKKDADDSAKSFRKAASAVSSVGSAMQSIEDPSAKIMGIIAQAVANIALAFSKADVKDGETGNVWYWIAATAAGVATMVSTISSIKSATSGYAGGGIIKGNSYSGDRIGGLVDGSQLVGLNAGEVVLNASQQSMLASNIQGSGGGKMEIVGVLTGENVVLMADRWGRRTGRGELLFAKNL